MSKLTKDEELYVEQMNHWLQEQAMLEKQLKDTIAYHEFLKSSNEKQLALHQERIALARKDYDQWMEDHRLNE